MDFKRSSEIFLLPVDNIVSNIKQARKHYERRNLESLCESISENGLIQPITVRPLKYRKYEIISGERRFRACIMAGITHIPSIIIESTDERAAVLSLTENIQSQMLNFFDEAEAITNLINNYSYSKDYLASLLGKSTHYIEKMLNILSFSKEIREKMIQNSLTENHAAALLRLADEAEINYALEIIITKKLSASQTEELIERIIKEKIEKSNRKIKMIFKDIKLFINTFDHTVETMNKSGIEAKKERLETNSYIRYTVTIPKTPCVYIKSDKNNS